ncbi:hypothetical protein NDN08_008064 [Rhodosorus marinus]|uniref:RNA polymerase Rpb7-like N-terminal domain-containing protein n=2 Tax=Rhodosorus marinus TaxID=101924 RepID=A0AAV8V4B7_9RHOD|nr:hypothetical protein NDN08_008064 [Rhodosorus marinus]|eukprot:CAMPEP_0113961236 /NCGR_PEP_ID=MMETSP0011_2-20120614/5190_1 /TAXON_ID=101924 /ORGANISM="Rhodosorus marinus" /LENGTH=178 /DNA_ID=CAMNT_0000972841 /DNA_START=106 /DNA_END=642 /DNA_ORIENTATION=- /assembly_acc=CAM_ASM_000156
MGFFVVKLVKDLQVHPRFFNASLSDTLKQRLISEVEGQFAGRHGFIVIVQKIEEPIPVGEIDSSTGFAVFPIKYHALVFRPFRGEVLDSIVTRVLPHGFLASAGPLDIFVSHHCLPSDMKYDQQGECWVSINQADKIETKTAVRLKLIGLKVEATKMHATGSMKEDFLGPIASSADYI